MLMFYAYDTGRAGRAGRAATHLPLHPLPVTPRPHLQHCTDSVVLVQYLVAEDRLRCPRLARSETGAAALADPLSRATRGGTVAPLGPVGPAPPRPAHHLPHLHSSLESGQQAPHSNTDGRGWEHSLPPINVLVTGP